MLDPTLFKPITKLAARGADWLLSGLAVNFTLQQFTCHSTILVTATIDPPSLISQGLCFVHRPICLKCRCVSFGDLLEGTILTVW